MVTNANDVGERLEFVHALIEKVSQDPDALAALDSEGFGEEQLETGHKLHAAALSTQTTLEVEQAALDAVASEFSAARDAGRRLWDRIRALSDEARDEHPEAFARLGRRERIEESFAEWATQTRVFYETVLGDPEMLAALETFGLTRQELEAGYDAIVSVEALHKSRHSHQCAVQEATRSRDTTSAALHYWMEEFNAAAERAGLEFPKV